MNTKDVKNNEIVGFSQAVIDRHKGLILCPYCNEKALFTGNDVVYGKRYGNGGVWVCPNFNRKQDPRDSYVGCHDDGTPLGTLANKELRQARHEAHNVFDKLWRVSNHQDPQQRRRENAIARTNAYKKLARYIGVTQVECHIGKFDLQKCKNVLEFVKIFSKLPPDYAKVPEISDEVKFWAIHVSNPATQKEEIL